MYEFLNCRVTLSQLKSDKPYLLHRQNASVDVIVFVIVDVFPVNV